MKGKDQLERELDLARAYLVEAERVVRSPSYSQDSLEARRRQRYFEESQRLVDRLEAQLATSAG